MSRMIAILILSGCVSGCRRGLILLRDHRVRWLGEPSDVGHAHNSRCSVDALSGVCGRRSAAGASGQLGRGVLLLCLVEFLLELLAVDVDFPSRSSFQGA